MAYAVRRWEAELCTRPTASIRTGVHTVVITIDAIDIDTVDAFELVHTEPAARLPDPWAAPIQVTGSGSRTERR